MEYNTNKIYINEFETNNNININKEIDNIVSNYNTKYLKNGLFFKNMILIIHSILLLLDLLIMLFVIIKEINFTKFLNFNLKFSQCVKNILLLEFYLIIISFFFALPILSFAILKYKLNSKTIWVNFVLIIIMIIEIIIFMKIKKYKSINNLKIIFMLIICLLLLLLFGYSYNIYKFIFENNLEIIKNKQIFQNQSVNEVFVK